MGDRFADVADITSSDARIVLMASPEARRMRREREGVVEGERALLPEGLAEGLPEGLAATSSSSDDVEQAALPCDGRRWIIESSASPEERRRRRAIDSPFAPLGRVVAAKTFAWSGDDGRHGDGDRRGDGGRAPGVSCSTVPGEPTSLLVLPGDDISEVRSREAAHPRGEAKERGEAMAEARAVAVRAAEKAFENVRSFDFWGEGVLTPLTAKGSREFCLETCKSREPCRETCLEACFEPSREGSCELSREPSREPRREGSRASFPKSGALMPVGESGSDDAA